MTFVFVRRTLDAKWIDIIGGELSANWRKHESFDETICKQ